MQCLCALATPRIPKTDACHAISATIPANKSSQKAVTKATQTIAQCKKLLGARKDAAHYSLPVFRFQNSVCQNGLFLEIQ